MKSLSIDLETWSSVDISKSGVYHYAEAEDFAILLFAYAVEERWRSLTSPMGSRFRRKFWML